MAQVRGILSLAVQAGEGVPLSSVAIPQRSSIAPIAVVLLPSSAPTGASLSHETGAPSFNKYALKFLVRGGKAYLADYSDLGILFGDFADAKLFLSLQIATNLSLLFSCEVVRVLIYPDGTTKLALMNDGRQPDASKGETENKINPAHCEDCAGVERADGAVQTPPSFLITKPANGKRILQDAHALLHSFISTFC